MISFDANHSKLQKDIKHYTRLTGDAIEYMQKSTRLNVVRT